MNVESTAYSFNPAFIVLCSWAGKTLYSHSAILHPGVQMGAGWK